MTDKPTLGRRPLILGGVALAGAAAAGIYALRGTGAPEQTMLTAITDAQASDADAGTVPDMVLGDPDAPIEIIEYASFTCPHCANFHKEVFPQLKAEYIDTGKAKLVIREVYFDRLGLWAAAVARCGGEARYFGISDLIYERQREWTKGDDANTIIQNLFAIGRQAGLTDDELDACLRNEDNLKAMVATYQANAERDGITGTPSFLINGDKHSNMGWPDFKDVLEGYES
ncbi:DsbA family protein [Oceanomicrobium pacificus]|uniref:Thioredoxin domain-containing protein n=1 Tax=Oceanomicrobium pacificus TaxID=2692916 RepID=A0A6B0TV60_9RHOB|nr:DsbA family protein [Oceanomicrobium pacificus]MXU64843.1 thioredoxin domain-containing protein [Oceanomicrobium pacificus]